MAAINTLMKLVCKTYFNQALQLQVQKQNSDFVARTNHMIFFIENGIKAEEQGEVKNKGTDNEIQSVRGSYSYTGPDGVLYTVTYIADENGLSHINQPLNIYYVFRFSLCIFRFRFPTTSKPIRIPIILNQLKLLW